MREVRVRVTLGGCYVGSVEPFVVESPWWADVEPVNAHLERLLGVATYVLRLVAATGEGGRGGVVTYDVEARATPRDGGLRAEPVAAVPDCARRLSWARPGGPAELVDWADQYVWRTGPAVQVRTWNLSCLFRLPTADGAVWLKALPHFAADEAAVIRRVAEVDASLVPSVLAAAPGRLLMTEAAGSDCWEPTLETIEAVLPRWVAVQATLAERRGGADGALPVRPVRMAYDFGLPDTLVHGDLHPGNWRSSGVVLDWADAHWGHPALDAARLCEYTAPALHAPLERIWTEAWLRHRPDSDPRAALRHARPVTHLANAARYREFLAGIEDSERVYHEGDPEVEEERARSAALRLGPPVF